MKSLDMHYYVKCQGQSEDIRNFVSTSTDTMILSSDCKSDKDLYPVVTLNTYDVTHKKSKTPHFFIADLPSLLRF